MYSGHAANIIVSANIPMLYANNVHTSTNNLLNFTGLSSNTNPSIYSTNITDRDNQ